MTTPRAAPVANATYIHGTEPSEQERLALLNRLSNSAFLEWLALEPGETALEVGSGLGLLCAEAARRTRGHVVGVELSSAQLARVPRGTRQLHFVRGDAQRLPIADGKEGRAGAGFDRAWCRYLLEHVPDPLAVLREMRRVLAPGGRAHAQENDVSLTRFDPPCPTYDHVWARFAELQSRLGGDALIGARLYRLFHDAGFVEIELSLAPEAHWSGSPNFEGWVRNIVGNVRSAADALVREKLATAAEVTEAQRELLALLPRRDASALFAWNRAQGRKPASA